MTSAAASMNDEMTSSSPKRQRNHRGEGARLKDELVQAAMRILDAAPGTPISLRMVAREAGVAAPSVYAHFPDARTMMTEIVRECWSQVGDEMAAAVAITPPCDPVGALRAQFSAFVHYAMKRPSRYQLLFALIPIDTVEADRMEGHLRPAYRQVMQTIEGYVAEGGRLPGRDIASSTLLLISLAHGRIALAHLAPHRAGNSENAVKAFVFDAIDRLFVLEV